MEINEWGDDLVNPSDTEAGGAGLRRSSSGSDP